MEELIEDKKASENQQWWEIVQEQQKSGRTIREYCAEKRINSNSYYYRLRQIRKAAREKSEQHMVALDLSETQGGGKAAAILRLGSMTIEISNDANAETIKAIVSVLREC